MASRKKPMWATNLDTGESVNTNPLRPTDCEPWAASDSKKAQVLLSRNFPDRNIEDMLAMIELLRTSIGQDYPEIEASIKQYLLEDG